MSKWEENGSTTFVFLEGLIEQPVSEEIDGLYDGPYCGYFRCDYFTTKIGPDPMEAAMRDGKLQSLLPRHILHCMMYWKRRVHSTV